MQPLLNYIGGSFVPSNSGDTIEDINPATNQRITTLPRSSSIDVDKATQAAIEVQDAQVEEARVNYEKRVLTAFEEVENAIKSYKEEKQRNASLNVSVTAAKKVNKITLARYTSGLIDFQEVQDAERVIFFQEDELAISDGNLVQFIIQLYKAMGGGWEDTEIVTDEIVNEQN